eukprot:scaffold426680_cov31-Prasinocladus_malaysianus.AAC.1
MGCGGPINGDKAVIGDQSDSSAQKMHQQHEVKTEETAYQLVGSCEGEEREFALTDEPHEEEGLADDNREQWFPDDNRTDVDGWFNSLQTHRMNAGVWLANRQGLPTLVRPVKSQTEVELFISLLPKFERKSGTIDYDGLTSAFNAEVLSTLHSSTPDASDSEQPGLKITKFVRDYCDLLKKRMRLQKSCADWVEHLKAVRRALRDDSYASWTAATGPEQLAAENRLGNHERSSEDITAEQKATPLATEHPTPVSAAASSNRKKRAPQKCVLCQQPRQGDAHTAYGYCHTHEEWLKTSHCKLCDHNRREDASNHLPDGLCKRVDPPRRPGKGNGGRKPKKP